MELTHDDVLEILATVERSDVEYLELDVAGMRLVIDKSGGQTVTQSLSPGGRSATGDTAPGDDTAAPVVPTVKSAAPDLPTPADGREGLIAIEAPMVGVFYRAPEPGADPYAQVGDVIDAADTVGLVEVMKMFNSVTAGVSGTIVDILAENEQFVEYGEPLILVLPEPST